MNPAIGFVGMEKFRHQRVELLSDGERQRVLIALALAQDTPVILLDEPLAFLDVPHGMEIAQVMGMLKEQGKSLVFSTHDPDMLFRYCDKAWLIHCGQVLQGSPEDLGMEGAYDRLFQEFDVRFDLDDMRFKPQHRSTRSAHLIGESGTTLEWTRKALQRIGFQVEKQEEQSSCRIEVGGEGEGWKVSLEDKKEEFQTLYDMIRYLTGAI